MTRALYSALLVGLLFASLRFGPVVATAGSPPPPTTPTTAPPSTSTTSTTLPRQCSIFESFFDVFVDLPLPTTDRAPTPSKAVQQAVTGCRAPSTAGDPCKDHDVDLPIAGDSSCFQRVGDALWPDWAILDGLSALGRDADRKCADVCSALNCGTSSPKPFCVGRGHTRKTTACVPVIGLPGCGGPAEGLYRCTARMTVCRCRCSKSPV